MVKEIDITDKVRKGREEFLEFKGLIEKILGDGSKAEIWGSSIVVIDDQSKQILVLDGISGIVYNYLPSYEKRAREIAEAYDDISDMEIKLIKDYSNIN